MIRTIIITQIMQCVQYENYSREKYTGVIYNNHTENKD